MDTLTWPNYHASMKATCSIEGCSGVRLARGLCQMHYWRSRHGVPLDAPKYEHGGRKVCSVDGCDELRVGQGLCGLHYARQRKGQPLDAPKHTGRGGDRLTRLMKLVDKTPTCWLYTGYLTKEGYPPARQHRKIYELLVGPIPEGMQLDHLCYVRNCVNPDHLEPVTNDENARRAAEHRTTCRNGHDRSLTRVTDGRKICSVCERASQRRYLAKKKVIA